jgi:hypothetical protein
LLIAVLAVSRAEGPRSSSGLDEDEQFFFRFAAAGGISEFVILGIDPNANVGP